MENLKKPATLVALSILPWLAPPRAAADGLKGLARELSRAAQRAQIGRVAVLPFVPADASSPREGWNISEKLVTQLVRQDRVQAVERSLLKSLLDEQRLSRTGVIDAATIKKIGKVFAVDGVVTGSFVSLGNETMVNARLIEVETGVIVAAAERKTGREWFDALGLSAAAPTEEGWPVPVPEFAVDAPVQAAAEASARHGDGCAEAAEEVDAIERGILELKARYWAAWLRRGGRLAELKSNPGSTITDPLLRREFYRRLQAWYEGPATPDLTPPEVRRFVDQDQRAFALHQECNL